MRWRTWLLVATFVAVASGCGNGSENEPSRPVEERAQTIDPSKADVLELGDTLEVVSELPQKLGADQVYFHSFAENDVLVGSVTPVEDSSMDGGTHVQSHPVMYDLGTKKLTVLDDRDRPKPTWVSSVRGNEDAVVWVEGSGTTIDHSTFVFYAYDRRTKEVTSIGEFSDPDGQIVYGNDLDIAGGKAYFSTPAYPAKSGQEAVYAVPVDGSSPPEVLAAGGERVRIWGDTLSYWMRNPHDAAEYPRRFTHDLSTGETTEVPVNAHADESGFCGAETAETFEAWCLGRGDADDHVQDATLTIEETSGRTTTFEPFPTDSLNGPVPHDVMTLGPWTAITMTTDDGQDRKYLVDLDSGVVKVFPDNTSFGPVSPDRSMVLIGSFADRGPGPQRVVRIPGH